MRGFSGFDAQRNLVGYGDAVTFESDHLFWVIGEDADVFQAEVNQDLRADAALVLDHSLSRGFAVELAAFMKMDLRQRAGFVCRFDAETAAGVMEIEKNAAVFFGDGGQRARDEFAAIAGGRAEDIASEAMRVYTDESGCFAFEAAADQSDVLIVVNVA